MPCAVRNSKAAAERARTKLEKEARRKKKVVREETMEAAGYTMVLVTVKKEEMNARQVLRLYRARWQVELAFKRLKSLMKVGELPKRTDSSCKGWLQAKMLLVLLTERLMEEARSFSPWGFELEEKKSLARV